MALIKTDYGLIYNDDGRLCTTKRNDIVPFQGVTSYAVETATTNYLAPYAWEFDSEQTLFYPYNLAAGKTWADCWDEKQKTYVGGRNLTVSRIDTRSIDLGSVQAAGTKITSSWKYKGYLGWFRLSYSLDNITYTNWQSGDTVECKGDSSFRSWGNGVLFFNIDGKNTQVQAAQLLDRWYNVEITYTLPSDTRYITLNWEYYGADNANGGLGVLGYLRQPQLEIKPFATSFVNGSRQNGAMKIDIPSLDYNNFVFSCWANKRYVNYGWQMLTTIFTPDYSTVSEGNHYSIRLRSDNKIFLNLNSVDYGISLFPMITINDGWHFFVVAVHDNMTDFWIDNIKYTTQKYVTTSLNKRIYLGTWRDMGYEWQSQISNICIGKYKDNTGNVIWTDQFIKEQYEMNRPYFVPPKVYVQ